jgi:hypothetical protein
MCYPCQSFQNRLTGKRAFQKINFFVLKLYALFYAYTKLRVNRSFISRQNFEIGLGIFLFLQTKHLFSGNFQIRIPKIFDQKNLTTKPVIIGSPWPNPRMYMISFFRLGFYSCRSDRIFFKSYILVLQRRGFSSEQPKSNPIGIFGDEG